MNEIDEAFKNWNRTLGGGLTDQHMVAFTAGWKAAQSQPVAVKSCANCMFGYGEAHPLCLECGPKRSGWMSINQLPSQPHPDQCQFYDECPFRRTMESKSQPVAVAPSCSTCKHNNTSPCQTCAWGYGSVKRERERVLLAKLAKAREIALAMQPNPERWDGDTVWAQNDKLLKLAKELLAALTAAKEPSPSREELVEALKKIMHELGVPQPGYPQPVANAYEIAKQALSAAKEPVTPHL